jgi:hypothetical protein
MGVLPARRFHVLPALSSQLVGGTLTPQRSFNMKSKLFVSAMLVGLLALSFGFVGCDTGDGGGGGA